MYDTIGRHSDLQHRIRLIHDRYARESEAVILAFLIIIRDGYMGMRLDAGVIDHYKVSALNQRLALVNGAKLIKVPRRTLTQRALLLHKLELLVIEMLLEEYEVIESYARNEIQHEELRFGRVYQTFGRMGIRVVEDEDVDEILSGGFQAVAMATRLWGRGGHRDYLMKELKKFIRQFESDPDTFVETLSKRLDRVFEGNAGMLTAIALTELSRAQTETRTKLYEKNQVSKYRFVTELDGRVCEVCNALDGMVFTVAERAEGVNAPLMHFRCRCTDYPVEVNID